MGSLQPHPNRDSRPIEPRLSLAEQRAGFRVKPAEDGRIARVAFSGAFVGSKVYRAGESASVKKGHILSLGKRAFRVEWDDGSITTEAKADFDVILVPDRTASALTEKAEALVNGAWADEDGHYFLAPDSRFELMYGPRSYYWSVVDQDTGEEIASGTAESVEEARYRSADAYDRLVLGRDQAPVEEDPIGDDVSGLGTRGDAL